ncbi:MAG: aspartate/glutamate racemase family protein [Chromatiales bacterium]|jgi:allantoin racemase|nr:aspartate/glutamate racemase family protein [Chromatiales bacterium]
MKIAIINPNSTVSMTDTMVAAALAVKGPGTQVMGMTAGYGPVSIEGYYDEVFSVPPMLEAIQSVRDEVDGVVVGCFDDTGVDAARCVIDGPVIGICQAAMQAAAVVSGSFSVVTTLRRSVPALEHLAVKYGFERMCRRVRACEVPVLELEDPAGGAGRLIRAEIAAALEEDGAESIILGCAGMASFAAKLSDEFGVPIIEGVGLAVKTLEGLVSVGLSTSRRCGYARPRAKPYVGEFSRYSPREP